MSCHCSTVAQVQYAFARSYRLERDSIFFFFFFFSRKEEYTWGFGVRYNGAVNSCFSLTFFDFSYNNDWNILLEVLYVRDAVVIIIN